MSNLLTRVAIGVAAALAGIAIALAAIGFLVVALYLYLVASAIDPARAALIVGAALLGLLGLAAFVLWVASRRGAGARARRHVVAASAALGNGGVSSLADLADLAAREATATAEAHPYGTFSAAFLAGLALGSSPDVRDLVKTVVKAVDGSGAAR